MCGGSGDGARIGGWRLWLTVGRQEVRKAGSRVERATTIADSRALVVVVVVVVIIVAAAVRRHDCLGFWGEGGWRRISLLALGGD